MMSTDMTHEDKLSDADELFERSLEYDDGEEARSILRRGFPIYYAEQNTPENCVIKEYPDGRRELVSFMSGTEELICAKV